MNTRKLGLLSCLLALTNLIMAQAPVEKSLGWKITGNGLNKPSYLYGTIHLIEKKDFFLSANTKKAFKETNMLALEIDLNMDKETKQQVATATLLPDNKSLKDFMSESDYQVVEKYLKETVKLGVLKMMVYQRIKPFFLSGLLLKEQLGKTQSYEETFQKMAKKKPQVGLEGITDQVNLIASVPVEKQVRTFVQGIRENKDAVKEFQKLIDVYKRQDLQEMNRLTVEESTDFENFQEEFINKRNRNWIPVIKNLIHKDQVFIAVGAAHLGGEEGVISLLRKEGYIIEPIY
jgi:uncharacterized protein